MEIDNLKVELEALKAGINQSLENLDNKIRDVCKFEKKTGDSSSDCDIPQYQVKNVSAKTTGTAEIKQKSSKSATSKVPQQKRRLPATASYTPPKRRRIAKR